MLWSACGACKASDAYRPPSSHVRRYYADPGRLAALLARVAAQMERGSRAHILAAGRVWDRQRPALVADLDLAVALNEAFHAQFKCGPACCMHSVPG